MKAETQKDGRGNPFVEINNLRVTCVLEKPPGKKWDKNAKLYLRMQAYKDGSKRLHRGAELPITNQQTLLKLISAIAYLGTEHMGAPRKRN
jgi:hypothetical protein